MSKDSKKLNEVNKKLDEEIDRIKRMKNDLENWANEERKSIDQQRSERLRAGKISLTELNDMIDILEDYENATDPQKQFVESTLMQLSQLS